MEYQHTLDEIKALKDTNKSLQFKIRVLEEDNEKRTDNLSRIKILLSKLEAFYELTNDYESGISALQEHLDNFNEFEENLGEVVELCRAFQ